MNKVLSFVFVFALVVGAWSFINGEEPTVKSELNVQETIAQDLK